MQVKNFEKPHSEFWTRLKYSILRRLFSVKTDEYCGRMAGSGPGEEVKKSRIQPFSDQGSLGPAISCRYSALSDVVLNAEAVK